MPISWSEVITDEFRQNANIALSSFILTTGEKDDLALFYGVGRRTVERWFSAIEAQRRPCMTQECTGKRLVKMEGSPRLEYLRQRSFLPCLLAVDAGIQRSIDLDEADYTVKVKIFDRPSLDLCIETAMWVPAGRETRFLQVLWLGMEILEQANPRNPWRLIVRYAKPKKYEDLKNLLGSGGDPEEEEDEGEAEYDEYDNNPTSWVWEPD